VHEAASLRNVAVVGHGGCGKTQLVSALLLAAGAVNRLGLVNDGTTATDFDEEELTRKHTLSSSLVHADWGGLKINLIDTPGFANFLTDARAALRVVEAARAERGIGARRGRVTGSVAARSRDGVRDVLLSR
jgi:elongation factor G